MLRDTALFACALLLAACATPATVKEALADKNAYLQQNFAYSTLTSDVRRTVEKSPDARGGTGRVVLRSEMSSNVEGRIEVLEVTDTYIPERDGVVLKMREVKNNGVLRGIIYSSSYRGVTWLKLQQVPASSANAQPMREVKSFEHFDPIGGALRPGQVLSYAYHFSLNPIQVVNFRAGSAHCTMGSRYPAAKLSPKLVGDAIEMDCDYTGANDVVIGKGKNVYFEHYGFAYELEGSTDKAKNMVKIVGVDF